MANIWVTSDTHFGHDNIISYCDRPFKNSKEMDEALLENWNSVVKPGDKVYHLGDVYFAKGQEHWGSFFSKLNGSKRLVLGNHDDGKDKVLHNTFQKIMVWRMFPDFGLLLTHVPVHESSCERRETKAKWDNDRQEFVHVEKRYFLRNVHGHIHDRPSPTDMHVNVSVERTDYTPVNIEELRIK